MTVTIGRNHMIMGVILFAVVGGCGFQWYKTNDDRISKESFRLSLNMAEIRLLQQELATERSKPSFEEGFRSCVLHMGGAQQTGSYKDGWDAAVAMLNNQTYADGYHAAIEQFGFQAQGKLIVPKPIGTPVPIAVSTAEKK